MPRHLLLRLGYRLSALLPRRSRQGVAVAVWRGHKVLLVRHSYKSGWFLPGGSPKRGEALADAARRELREETGIEADAEALTACFTTAWIQILEYCPCRDPELRIDRREVVEARFADPARMEGMAAYMDDYLLSRVTSAPRPVQPGSGSSG